MENHNLWDKNNLETGPPRWSRLLTYLHDEFNETALEHAKQLMEYGPIEAYGVLIPVAAHQESGSIANAMDQYAAQEGADPFSVVLYLNSPEGSDQAAIDGSVGQVEQAIAKHPQLDIRYVNNTYPAKTPIGQIRKDLWDAAGLLVARGNIYNAPDGEFFGINHDIDTVSIGKHYIRNIQNYYKQQQSRLNTVNSASEPMMPRFTQVKHAYPFDTHPNIAKTMAWVDYAYRQHSPNGTYEEGLVVPLSHYAAQKGFDPEAQTYETERLLAPTYMRDGIPRTPMETSPRRYIDRLATNALSDIWTNESFGANDECRDGVARADISHSQTEERIMETLNRDLLFFIKGIPGEDWARIVSDRIYEILDLPYGRKVDVRQEVEALIRPKLKLAEQVLRRVVKSDTLADLVIDDSTVAGFVQAHADEIERGVSQNWSLHK